MEENFSFCLTIFFYPKVQLQLLIFQKSSRKDPNVIRVF